jgi:hypothetical protein
VNKTGADANATPQRIRLHGRRLERSAIAFG